MYLIQLRLEAYDTNNPALRAVGLSFITVNRNPATPIFTSADYQYTAEEVLPVGSILITVNATDSDQVRCMVIICITTSKLDIITILKCQVNMALAALYLMHLDNLSPVYSWYARLSVFQC